MSKIKYQVDGAIATITLNRPERMNALDGELIQQFRAKLEEIQQDESIRVVVVTGEGKAWSAGVDLAVFETMDVKPGYKMFEDGLAIMEYLQKMPQVSICKLNGYCFTGALELMMAFDMVIAADSAKIGDTHTKWGIQPTWGMTQRLQQLVGLRKAKELSFTAQTITGAEAARIGLVNQSVPLEELDKAVNDLIEKIIPNSQQTIAAMKKLYHYGSTHTLEEGLLFEQSFVVNLTDKKSDLKDFKKKI